MILLFSEHRKENLLHPFIATIKKTKNHQLIYSRIYTHVCLFYPICWGRSKKWWEVFLSRLSSDTVTLDLTENNNTGWSEACPRQPQSNTARMEIAAPDGQDLLNFVSSQLQDAVHVCDGGACPCRAVTLWWGKRHDGIHRVRGTEHTDTGSEVEALPAPRVVTDPQQHVFPLMVQQNVLPPSSFFFLKAFFFSLCFSSSSVF